METIFDHHPTPDELLELIGNIPKRDIIAEWESSSIGENILYIVLLFEKRKDFKTAEKYSEQIPELYQEWKLGLDYAMVSMDNH